MVASMAETTASLKVESTAALKDLQMVGKTAGKAQQMEWKTETKEVGEMDRMRVEKWVD